MKDELRALLEKSQAKRKAFKKLIDKIEKSGKKEMDQVFHSEHDKVFEQIDCLDCANCCSTTSPIFRDVDIRRLAAHLRMKDADFIERYLILDEEGDYVLVTSPCAFLGTDNKCAVYEVRPLACKEYPHTDRKNMYQIKELTWRNSRVCPAVAQIFENLSVKYNNSIQRTVK